MKKLIGIFIVAILSCASVPTSKEQILKEISDFTLPILPEENNAVVYVFRPGSYGGAMPIELHVDDEKLPSPGGVYGMNWLAFPVNPGSHKLISFGGRESKHYFFARAKETYFFQLNAVGFMIPQGEFVPVTTEQGTWYVKNLMRGKPYSGYKPTTGPRYMSPDIFSKWQSLEDGSGPNWLAMNQDKGQKYNTFDRAFEGYQFLKSFALDKKLNPDQRIAFIAQLFQGVSEKNPVGNPLMLFQINNFYLTGEPLRILTTTAFDNQGKRALTVVSNVKKTNPNDSMDKLDSTGAGTDYPALNMDGNPASLGKLVVFSILPNHRISASPYLITPTLPLKMYKSTMDKLIAVGNFLRGSEALDEKEFLPFLEGVIQNTQVSAEIQAFGLVTLGHYYLKKNGLKKAEDFFLAHKSDPCLSNEKAISSGTTALFLEDFGNIIQIAKGLN